MDKNRFRGVSMVSKKWIYGDCLHVKDNWILIKYDENENREPIYSESLGQSTGYVDSKGTEIFEGDIMLLPKDIMSTENVLKAVVTYTMGMYTLVHTDVEREIPLMLYISHDGTYMKGEVIGTNFDKNIPDFDTDE